MSKKWAFTSKRNPVGKQRWRITLRDWIWECMKLAHQHSHRLWAQRVYDRRDCDSSDAMYRENLENNINKFQEVTRIWINSGTKLTRSGDGKNVTHWEDVFPPVQDALRRVYGKQCRLWSRRWRDTIVVDFITVCPRSFWETRCNGHFGKWGKCINVSFIRSGATGRPVALFYQHVMNRETKRGVQCSETLMCRFWVKLYSKAMDITCWIEQERI